MTRIAGPEDKPETREDPNILTNEEVAEFGLEEDPHESDEAA